MIKPALDAFEWRNTLTGNSDTGDVLIMPDGQLSLILEDGVVVRILNRHGAAALALHGQTFGFTREDVEELRQAAETIRVDYRVWKAGREEELGYVQRLLSTADRIEALLQPKP